MWGRYELLEVLPAYKVRPSKDVPPYRWETGTPAFELIAGVGAAVDYIASLGLADGAPQQTADRAAIIAAMDTLQQYERELTAHLIEGLSALPGVHMAGITDPSRFNERVPTVVFVREGYTPTQIAEYLAARDIYVWDGNYYAQEIMQRLGREDGMVRVGLAHYNTHEEVDRLLTALRQM
jgi:selenocysteine lyase/cysteine desulfurase